MKNIIVPFCFLSLASAQVLDVDFTPTEPLQVVWLFDQENANNMNWYLLSKSDVLKTTLANLTQIYETAGVSIEYAVAQFGSESSDDCWTTKVNMTSDPSEFGALKIQDVENDGKPNTWNAVLQAVNLFDSKKRQVIVVVTNNAPAFGATDVTEDFKTNAAVCGVTQPTAAKVSDELNKRGIALVYTDVWWQPTQSESHVKPAVELLKQTTIEQYVVLPRGDYVGANVVPAIIDLAAKMSTTTTPRPTIDPDFIPTEPLQLVWLWDQQNGYKNNDVNSYILRNSKILPRMFADLTEAYQKAGLAIEYSVVEFGPEDSDDCWEVKVDKTSAASKLADVSLRHIEPVGNQNTWNSILHAAALKNLTDSRKRQIFVVLSDGAPAFGDKEVTKDFANVSCGVTQPTAAQLSAELTKQNIGLLYVDVKATVANSETHVKAAEALLNQTSLTDYLVLPRGLSVGENVVPGIMKLASRMSTTTTTTTTPDPAKVKMALQQCIAKALACE